jgi:aerobic carbon-monoxide dehydrogenase medium subunit
MIPATFDYVRAGIGRRGRRGAAPARRRGQAARRGHSLLPLMKLRLAAPEVLVDLGRVEALRGVREEGDDGSSSAR